jgi:predicted transcriptional regulator
MNDKMDWKALESMTAADVMTAAPRTCSTFSTVLEAVMIFRDNDCGAVPILEDGKPVAILTDRDVALAISQFPDLSSRPVSSIITPGIVSVAAEDRLERVCEVLRAQGVRRTLVVDSHGLVTGIIGWADIAPVLSDRIMGQVVKNAVSPS